MFLTTKENWSVEAPEIYQKIKVGEFRYIMSILDDLQALYDNGWDASFDYKGQTRGIFPNSTNDISIMIGDKEYKATSFFDLISIPINGKTLPDIMSKVEVQYY